ncbi:MAG: DUF2975 domain-containing protein [Alphaproteobacteria bacterium]|nr:DUF2975 domain-containing protein [Alphaproteobacteria bacterium]MBV9371201.1 DUF2975 domain-containing protein [Alphaproteobacteria bacterium]MBV9899931.1 DUF2975 domain-containing protein [Alphaproteobacteria bacterium]
MDAGSDGLKTLRARSRLLAALVTLVFVVLALAQAMEVAVVASGRYPHWQLLVYRLPMLFYLWAIWTIRRATVSLAQGELFDLVVPRLLGRVGLALFLGALVNVFATPLLLRAAAGRGPVAHYDVAAITLGVVGATLVLVARLLAEAAAMRRELDEIL